MAYVFVGDAGAFNPEYVEIGHHHYNRPLLPFLAGYLGKYALGGNLRAAFTLVDILAVTLVAVLLMWCVRQWRPEWQFDWLPSVLFVSGFPQMNWGYHILSDTLGVCTGFAVAFYGAWLIRKADEDAGWRWVERALHLVLLFGSSAMAFLARETGWFAVITVGWLIFVRRSQLRSRWVKYGLVLAVIALGKIPHNFYAHHYHLLGVPLKSSLELLFNPFYVADLVVKTLVAFNLSWLVAALAAWQRNRERMPDFVVGWTLAAVLYWSAGYYNNYIEGAGAIGYPMRMAYPFFPFVFLSVTEFFEHRLPPDRRPVRVLGYCLLQYGINLIGVMLDSGMGKITVVDLYRRMKAFFGR